MKTQHIPSMLQEANIEEHTYCVMKSPSKKDYENSNFETSESKSMKTPKDEETSLCSKEREKVY